MSEDGKIPDPSEQNIGSESIKMPYMATFTWHPPIENPEQSPEPIEGIPTSNVRRKTFEYETKRIQDMSREELSRQRKSARQKLIHEKRDDNMSTNEMFEKLMEKLESRCDHIDQKLITKKTKSTDTMRL